MRLISALSLFALLASAGNADARALSGVVAVSTGPMQASYDEAGQVIGRDLTAGDDVFLNDEVSTGKSTQAQVLLMDESVFSISPSSKVVFDSFVYDPNGTENTLEANLVTGGMRFISGKIASRTPQNIKIKVGEATVGIRGTEILARHDDAGSTFVLLSGAMEVAAAGRQTIINRPGYGIDVSPDGMLGAIRRISPQELQSLQAAPQSADEDKEEADGNAAEEQDSEDAASDENESEDTTSSAEDGNESEAARAQPADEKTEQAPSGAKNQAPAPSKFDAALADAAGDRSDQTSASNLTLIAAAPAALAPVGSADALPEAGGAMTGDRATIETVTVDTTAIQEAIAARADDAIISTARSNSSELSLSTGNTLTTNPFFSSNANLLVRSRDFFKSEAPGQFNVTHALMREKFPDSFNGNDFVYYAAPRPSEEPDLSSYDAVFIYSDWNNGSNTNPVERTAYRSFIHDDGKKILTVGRQENSMDTANSILRIYSPDEEATTYQYSTNAVTRSDPANYLLSPSNGSNSALLKGVDAFPTHYDNDNNFRSVEFEKTLNSVAQPLTDADEFILGSGDSFAAVDMGSKGAAFFSRWACSANGQGALGTSINANLVNNSREQFCRNLFPPSRRRIRWLMWKSVRFRFL